MSAIPAPDPEIEPDHILLAGEVADPSDPPPGCAFHPRCRYAVEQCRTRQPALGPVDRAAGRLVSCHLADDLALQAAPHQHLASRHRTLDAEALKRARRTPR